MTLKTFLLSLTLPFLLAACGDSTETVPVPLVTAQGKAHLSSPLVGASIELQNERGQAVMTIQNATGPSGTFAVALPLATGSRFRIAASGGTYEGKPFAETLLLDVERFDPQRDLLYVNAATTLVSRYINRHPSASVAEASAKVKGFLRIPSTSNIGFDVNNPLQSYFRHELLLSTMQSAGGSKLGTYLDALVGEIDAGVPSHAFARAPLESSAGEVLSKFLHFLTDAVADEGFGFIFEEITTALGIDGTAEILKELHEINQKLDELKALTTEVLSEEKQTQAEIVTNTLLASMSNIKDTYGQLTFAAEACQSGCTQEQITGLRATVRRTRDAILGANGIRLNFALINSTLVPDDTTKAGGVGEPGVLTRWRNYLDSIRTTFDAPVTDPRLIALNDYYKVVQAMAVHLLVEAYMAQEDGGKPAPDRLSAQNVIQTLQTAAKTQDTLVAGLHRKDETTIEDLRTKLVWLRAPISNLDSSRLQYHSSDFHTWFDPNFHTIAKEQCSSLAQSKYAGYSGWRLPTDAELHAVVKGSPNNTGNADGGNGIFDWLIKQGFQAAPGNGQVNQRGFLVDSSMKTAYFSSNQTGISGWFWEALWDHGVDNACYADRKSYCEEFPVGAKPNTPSIAGAWCVTQQEK